ncbi:hypothetical protein LZ554_005595 [Drepanopeziza brunnea f. sp. 'monogermtubi']|nr:hypothetical protein LZ554_005595 [Drepanopeziza brunnea f. sp. 'monogermtubi']
MSTTYQNLHETSRRSRPPVAGSRAPRMDHSRITRTRPNENNIGNGPASGPGPDQPVLRPRNVWEDWDELTIKLWPVQPSETTYNLWRIFSRYGQISFIDIYENNQQSGKTGLVRIRFSPPPTVPFWNNGQVVIDQGEGPSGQYLVNVELDKSRPPLEVQSPVKKSVRYPARMKLYASALHFGLMTDPQSLMPLHVVRPITFHDTAFVVDLLKNKITATFTVQFPNPEGGVGRFDRENKYMFQVPFSQLTTIKHMVVNARAFALIISLDSPPQFFRKRVDEYAGHSDGSPQWNEMDTWFRQTDVVYDPYRLQTEKITLHKDQPVIDIGRWTTYFFEFPNVDNSPATFDTIKQALQDYNIEITTITSLNKVPSREPDLWPLIDPRHSADASGDLQYLSEGAYVLPFEVRYQLEARNILEYVAGQEKRVYDPMTIFEDQEALAFTAKTEIPHYCAYSRKATITPSTMYFSSPTVETTNRVLRHYARENRDGRFLRVQFTDELAEGRINACVDNQKNDELFTRIYRTLFNGIQIGDRHYEFLAFGNSQFRENGAYFFCPTEHLSCDDIRGWMGHFSDIKVVAKAINGLSKPDIVKIADIENNGYTFTDGVGKISPFLAQMISAELGLRTNTAPSAFQFRLGGCKGVLVVWPDAKEKEVHIRMSQQKFTAIYNGLEIIRCARFSCATLNRQTITILSALGVPDEVFLKMLSEQLANYQTAMDNDDAAVSLLLRYIDDNQMTINIATMIRNGFMAEKDPFVLSLLHLWRSWSIKLLKEKAKIIIENGAFVLGCVDETFTLRGYTISTGPHGEQVAEEELPQIFLQVPDKNDPNRYNIITGICLVGRNPSLHPGDLRVVQAVDVPALHHLRDVVVFPASGDRDIPSMCSGGDLDGDDFFVIWDEALRPREWNCQPMNYIAPKPKLHNQPVQIVDLMKFFVRFMKNDSLPAIAHAHLAQSDALPMSVKDPKCIELASLHSKAVDYVKTGEAAQMPKHLRPRKWPHFMEKKHKPKAAQYHSNQILGQLYDKVETVDFKPQYEGPFDKRILKAYTLDDAILKTVRQIKSKYDTAMKRLMAQQEIKTEFEIWSTFVLSRPRVGSDYKVQEEIARLSDALKDQFRAECIGKAGSKEFTVLGPFVAAMYKITKEELDIALAECRATKVVSGRQVPVRRMEPKHMPLISFPWLFEKELGRIATGIDTSEELEELGLATLVLKEPGRKRTGGVAAEDDYITREDGVLIHRGEELDLFHQMSDSENDADESDFDEARARAWDEHETMIGRDGEEVLATEFEIPEGSVPDYIRKGTGVEDVVPQVTLEGLIDPREAAKRGQDSNHPGLSSMFSDSHTNPQASTDMKRTSCGDPNTELLTPKDSPNASESRARSHSAFDDLAELESDSAEEIEEELVTFDVKESSLDKLARLISNEPASTPSPEHDGEVEEEEVVLDVKESSLEKLNRMMES